jgi:penicillin-binding protein-related factor A (putative recombinase)
MNPGKLFEQDFQNSVPPDAYVYRLKDCPGWVRSCTCPSGAGPRFVPSNDYDFMLYYKGVFWALELKSTKGVSFRYDCLRPNQRKGLSQANHIVEAGLLLNFRTEGETWYISIGMWERLERDSTKKSINIKEVRKYGYRLHGKLKVSRWVWDVQSWMELWV